jgi:hypothetical protein
MSRTIAFDVEVDSGQSVKTLGSLKTELASINEELENVEIGSKAFTELSDKARSTASEIKTLEKTFEGLEPQQKTEAFVKGFEAVSGAVAVTVGSMALFGVESERLGKIEQQVQGAIAIAVGARAIAEGALQAKVAARLVVEKSAAVATKALTVAQRIYNTVLAANPIFAIVTVIAAVTAGIYALTKALKDDTTQVEFNADEYERLSKAIEASNKERQNAIELANAQGKSQEEILELQVQNAKAAKDEATNLRIRAQTANQFSDETKKAREAEEEAIRQVTLAEERLATFRRDEAEKDAEAQRQAAAKRLEERRKEREQEIKEQQEFASKMRIATLRAFREAQETLLASLDKDIKKAEETRQKDFENRIKRTTEFARMQQEDASVRSISNLQAYAELVAVATEAFVESTAYQTTAELAATANGFFSDLLATQDESNEEGFEKSKKYKIAQVVTTSTQAAFDAFAGAQKYNAVVPGLGTAIGVALVAAIAAKTRTSIADIQSATFGDTSVPSTSGGGGGTTNLGAIGAQGTFTPIGQQATNTQLTPQFSAPTAPLRAYVIGQDIEDAAEAEARLNRRRTLGG